MGNKSKDAWEAAAEIIRKNADRWDADYVARKDVSSFSGFAYSPRTLANADSLKQGPSGAFRLGRTVIYPKQALVDWLLSRLTIKR